MPLYRIGIGGKSWLELELAALKLRFQSYQHMAGEGFGALRDIPEGERLLMCGIYARLIAVCDVARDELFCDALMEELKGHETTPPGD